MGKASKWFRGLLGLKKPDPPTPSPTSKPPKDKRRWSFVKSYREKDRHTNHHHQQHQHPAMSKQTDRAPTPQVDIVVRSMEFPDGTDPGKHAIAVAAATAAVAEAAVAAAQAAAAVVRLTSSGRPGNTSVYVGGNVGDRDQLAAVKIQAAFRGCLARKALRALKGLVRLQALVRGHIERKRTAEWLRRMQTLVKAQARARAGRAQISDVLNSTTKSSSHFQPPGPATPEKLEHNIRSKSMKVDQSSMLSRNGSRSNSRATNGQANPHLSWNQPDHQESPISGVTDNGNSGKILEVDTMKARLTPKRRNLFHSSDQQSSHSFTTSKDSTAQHTIPSSSCEIQSLSPLKVSYEFDEFCTADNSPQFLSASSRGGSTKRSPFTPTKSDGSSYLSSYSVYPSYMAFTESSKAKVRSLSAPRQRPQYERSSSTKRCSIQGHGEPNASTLRTSLHANFTSKAYPGSGRLDKLGMPVGYRY